MKRETQLELARVLKRGGYVAFEVGEVRNGRIKLEEAVLPCGVAAGLAKYAGQLPATLFAIAAVWAWARPPRVLESAVLRFKVDLPAGQQFDDIFLLKLLAFRVLPVVPGFPPAKGQFPRGCR
jgi:hypothetical protein